MAVLSVAQCCAKAPRPDKIEHLVWCSFEHEVQYDMSSSFAIKSSMAENPLAIVTPLKQASQNLLEIHIIFFNVSTGSKNYQHIINSKEIK